MLRSWSSINVLCTESGVATGTDPTTPPASQRLRLTPSLSLTLSLTPSLRLTPSLSASLNLTPTLPLTGGAMPGGNAGEAAEADGPEAVANRWPSSRFAPNPAPDPNPNPNPNPNPAPDPNPKLCRSRSLSLSRTMY